MQTDRRTFLALAGTTAATMAIAPASALAGKPRKGLRILILGGTGFLGPHVVEAALAKGHSLTLFNRGRTEQRKGGLFEGEDRIERRYGNRDPNKYADDTRDEGGNLRDPDSPKGLDQIREGRWDAVIDTSGYYPRMVKASAELLGNRAGMYVFISTVSVYASDAMVDADESDPVGTIPDPNVETMGARFENYGPLKALCEQAAEAAFPGRCANVRPGLIVGPGDETDRFTYWPARVARGGEVLSPGTPMDPTQYIDVRDLAEWIVTLVEGKRAGVFNAITPAGERTMGGLLDSCKAASGSDATFTWVDADFLRTHGVSAWGDLPAWIPAEGEYAGFGRRSAAAAMAAGLRFRPEVETCRATLEWWKSLDEARRAKPRAGLSPEKEKTVLALWHKPGG